MTMFLAGLMIGRTPELFGKKLEPFEMIMAVVGLLAPSVTVLILAAIAIVLPLGLSSLNNAGPHGLSEILYAFASACGNNGSAFAGLNANTIFYNLATALGYAGGQVCHHPAGSGHGRISGSKEDRSGQHGDFAGSKPALCDHARGHCHNRGRSDLLPGLRARPDTGASAHASRHDILR